MADPRTLEPPVTPDAEEYDEILFTAQMRQETHARLKEEAAAEGISVKTLLARLFQEAVNQEDEAVRGG
jgi:predicted HicB family RNase H-like nuclease